MFKFFFVVLFVYNIKTFPQTVMFFNFNLLEVSTKNEQTNSQLKFMQDK